MRGLLAFLQRRSCMSWPSLALPSHDVLMPAAGDMAPTAPVESDAIFDDVLALNPPSALWPRPAAIGPPLRDRRSAAGLRGRRLE